jgi:predicted Zn finger-like uncharacterized protein
VEHFGDTVAPSRYRDASPVDVQCERCKTEYEFDDALVSGRGTTVRCTNCGHQFKVKLADAPTSDGVQDRWVVTTAQGVELVYTSLRDLQRAIIAKQVGRGDVLMRGNGPRRTLGAIAELEPFFEGRASSRPPPPGLGRSPVVPPPPATPDFGAFPKRTPAWGIPAASDPAPPPPVENVPPPRAKISTLRPPTAAPPPAPPPPPSPLPPPPAQRATSPGLNDAARTAAPTPAAPVAPLNPPEALDDRDPATMPRGAYSSTPSDLEVSAGLPPPTLPRRRVISSIDEDAMADAMRSEMRHSLLSDPDSFGMPRRRRIGGWVVALVLLCGAGVLAAVVAKPYLQGLGKPAASAAALDGKALQFLNDGEKALAAGDLDAAKGDFDRASALAESNERVLLDAARLDAVRADLPWLELRVLRPEEVDETKLATQRLSDLSSAAKRSADAALVVAPEDASAIRAKIDAARIAGDRDSARHLVAKVVGQAQQPETAYVLAALDLAEADPVWSTVIERLKLAAQGEGDLGRARAALVYAYARSGDKVSAKGELDKLAALKRPYPLLGVLRSFVDRSTSKSAADGGVGDGGGPRTIDISQLPTSLTAMVPGATGTEEPLEGRTPTAQAMNALRKGDPSRARQILEARLAQNPNDSEAVSTLGDVCRAQGDSACAITQYKRALAINPSYLPAMIALADVYWGSGDRGDALRIYKEITERFPESAYPSYVRDRAGGGGAAASTASAAAPAATDTASAAPTVTATATVTTSAPAPAPKPSDGF